MEVGIAALIPVWRSIDSPEWRSRYASLSIEWEWSATVICWHEDFISESILYTAQVVPVAF